MKKLAVVASVVAVLVLAGCGAGTGEKSAGESNGAGESTGVANCPLVDVADMTEITQVRADLLVGFSEADAESCALSLGWVFRVGERDGEGFALTADYSQQRVTVSVTDDLVTAVAVG